MELKIYIFADNHDREFHEKVHAVIAYTEEEAKKILESMSYKGLSLLGTQNIERRLIISAPFLSRTIFTCTHPCWER